jgi:hypothetical protein
MSHSKEELQAKDIGKQEAEGLGGYKYQEATGNFMVRCFMNFTLRQVLQEVVV